MDTTKLEQIANFTDSSGFEFRENIHTWLGELMEMSNPVKDPVGKIAYSKLKEALNHVYEARKAIDEVVVLQDAALKLREKVKAGR